MVCLDAMAGVRFPGERAPRHTIVLVRGQGALALLDGWAGGSSQSDSQPETLDLRGHGRSDKPQHEDAYSMDLLVGDVAAVLDAAGAQAAHYVGYSAGSRIGFSLLASSPERVKTFTAAGGTYRSPAGQIASIFFPGYDRH